MDASVVHPGKRVQTIGAGLHVVASERLDVYHTDRSDSAGPGRGRYLGTVVRGDVCAGAVARAGSTGVLYFRCVAGSSEPPLLRRISPKMAHENRVARWLALLGAAPLKGPAPRAGREVRRGDRFFAESNTVVCARNRTVCVRLTGGKAYPYGRRSQIASVEGGPWPLAPNMWLVLESEAHVEVLSWSDVARNADLGDVLSSYTALTVRMLDQDAAVRGAVEIKRLHVRERADRRLMQSSCRSLASVLVPDVEPPHGDDPLEAAVSRVAADVDVIVKPGTAGSDRRPTVRLRAMARANRFRVRRVVLRGDWWRGEGASLLASWKPSPQDAPRLVAIRHTRVSRTRTSRFTVWDPVDGSETPVDAAVAAQFSPFAYTFYRRMPAEPWRSRTLAGLGLKGSAPDLWLLMLLGIAAGGLAAASPVLTGKVYDLAIPEASRSQLVQIIGLLLSLTLTSALLQFVRALAVLRLETRADAHVQGGVWDHLLALPARFFRSYTAGDLAMRAGGIAQIRQLTSGAATNALLTGIFSVWYLGLLFYYDVRMAAWVLGAITTLTAGSLALAGIQLRHQRRATRMQSRLSGLILQLITGLSKLRVAGAEVRAFARWANGFAEQRRSYVAGRRAGNLLAALQASAPVLLLALVYGLMVDDAGARLSTGQFLAFQTALLSLSGASIAITNIFSAASSALPLYEQLLPILRCERETDDTRTDPGELSGDIEIRHVTFSYSADAPPVLDDVSIHIKAGAFIAFVGPSGSGKSSLLRLLLGFETPGSGSIYFDGQDVAGMDLHALRRQFGVVLQEAGVLAGDIYVNIAGSADATLEDAWEAARLAGLADDIRAMPMGMHTVVDQNGVTISGGQRQRLMIARAIVTRPRILLFDEATSALDNLTQQHVSSSLAALNATRVVVAHRLTTVMGADVIYVFERGRIVEQGNYDSLMDAKGLFYRLAQRQLVA